jgi:tetratricopeptide (TPR) repeat protein
MKSARFPRELEQLRGSTRMSLYLEVKAFGERIFPGRLSKPESSRIAMEIVNRLCGENPPPGAPKLTRESSRASEEVLARLKAGETDLMVAASFMRWSKAVTELMNLKNDEADGDLRAAIELNPGNAFAHCSMAYLAGFQGDARRAVESAKKALELEPGLAEAWIELGNAYEALGEHSLALAAWEKAQSFNPDIIKTQDRGDAASRGLPGRDRPEGYDVLADESEDGPPRAKGT